MLHYSKLVEALILFGGQAFIGGLKEERQHTRNTETSKTNTLNSLITSLLIMEVSEEIEFESKSRNIQLAEQACKVIEAQHKRLVTEKLRAVEKHHIQEEQFFQRGLEMAREVEAESERDKSKALSKVIARLQEVQNSFPEDGSSREGLERILLEDYAHVLTRKEGLLHDLERKLTDIENKFSTILEKNLDDIAHQSNETANLLFSNAVRRDGHAPTILQTALPAVAAPPCAPSKVPMDTAPALPPSAVPIDIAPETLTVSMPHGGAELLSSPTTHHDEQNISGQF